MIERTPYLNILTHVILILLLMISVFPIIIVFVASTHDLPTVSRVPMMLWPGSNLIEN